MYTGKWFLDLDFLARYTLGLKEHQTGYCEHLYQQFNEVIKQGKNLGFMDCYRGDQLWRDYHTLKHFDNFVENTKLEPKRSNVFASMKWTNFYTAIWYAKFLWKGFGWRGFLNGKNLYYLAEHFVHMLQAMIGEMFYKHFTKGIPDNSQIELTRQEFTNYRYRPQLNTWVTESVAKSPEKVPVNV
jgi:hypothetical protein